MQDKDILESINELQKGSRLSLGMVFLGIAFLAGSIWFSASTLRPLQQQVGDLKGSIAQLEAKKAELTGFAAAVDASAKPANISSPESHGWVYIGRVSSAGAWAPKSDRIATSAQPAGLTSGATVTTESNAALVDDINTSANDVKPSTGKSSTRLFIRPGTDLVVADVKQQDTIGGGKLLWIKTKVASSALLALDQPGS